MGLEIHHVALGLFLFCILLVRSGVWAIQCWECNSEYDHRCGNPFHALTFNYTDCDNKYLDHFPEINSTVCRKIVQRVKGKYRYIRMCGFLDDERAAHGCYRRAGTFDVQIEYCQCKEDKCNDAIKTTSAHSAYILIAVSATAFLTASNTRWLTN